MGTLTQRDHDLLRRSAKLSRDAETVLADLGLPRLFERVGRPVRIGSTSFGLALMPDIDLGILCPDLDAGAIWDILRPLAEHPRVKRLRWTDERGPFNSTGKPQDEGIYCGVHVRRNGANVGEHWKLDCWFFPDAVPRPELSIRNRLLAASREERLAILQLKDAAIQDGRYGPNGDIHGIQVYQAVLDRGVRDYSEFVKVLASGGEVAHEDG